jgi:homoserine dehydrogenase
MFGGLEITGVQGIMNGTSNYILGRLEEGVELSAAIAEAQELGYAEADPTADIEGLPGRVTVPADACREA